MRLGGEGREMFLRDGSKTVCLFNYGKNRNVGEKDQYLVKNYM
jgi:hypothetical protein